MSCSTCPIQDIEQSAASICKSEAPKSAPGPAPFKFEPLLQKNYSEVHREYDLIQGSDAFISTLDAAGRTITIVKPQALTTLAAEAYRRVNFNLPEETIRQFSAAYMDPEASENDKFVIRALLQNAIIASRGVLPTCQDTGTAIIHGTKGQYVWTEGSMEEALSRGVYQTYTDFNLRYSQNAPLDMFREVNTRNNLPAQIEVAAADEGEAQDRLEFLFVAKGGGSANKSTLFQMTKAILKPEALEPFISNALKHIGTAACPPYHLAVVIGGTSAEYNMLIGKLASVRELDGLPTSGSPLGRAFRDLEYEEIVRRMARESGIGAQFGGRYYAVDARVIRLPRHGASCPISICVSCAADRQIHGYIDAKGIHVERLCTDPLSLVPKEVAEDFLRRESGEADQVGTRIDLDGGMQHTLEQIRAAGGVGSRLLLNGHLVVARDIAHARLSVALKETGKLPDELTRYPIYYAGPAKKPEGYPSGSMGPTTAQRMDPYVSEFMDAGASLVSIAKGNRTPVVAESCKAHGGFYLGSIGGPAALLAAHNIKDVKCLFYEDLGMEAVYLIQVKDFPAVIVTDDKGNDLYSSLLGSH